MNKQELLETVDIIKNVRKNKELIIDESNDEIFFLKCCLVNPQSYGALIQNRFININNGQKIKSSENKGNCIIDNQYYEIKSSISFNNCFNIVQLRPWQNIDYYLIFVNISEDVSISVLRLNHLQMMEEIENHKQSAHGTMIANQNNQNIEYRMTIDDDLLLQFKNKYAISNTLKI